MRMATTHYRIITATCLALASITLAAADDGNSSSSENSNASSSENSNASKESEIKSSESENGDSSNSSDGKSSDSQVSPVQSPARPYNLSIDAPVQLAGSDAAAKAFQTNVLPGMIATELKLLPEQKYESPSYLSSISFDPSKLVLSSDTAARVYFLGEGAGYQNTLGISTTNSGPLSPGASLIFPNASSSVGFNGSGKPVRSTGEPLLPGDFVDLGTLKAGTALDFFLISNGAVGGKDVLSTNKSLNADGIIHAVALSTPGSPYLVISFEDMVGGGDHDYNDVYFAVDLGSATTSSVAKLVSLGAPEPSLALGALLAGGAMFGFSRRRMA